MYLDIFLIVTKINLNYRSRLFTKNTALTFNKEYLLALLGNFALSVVRKIKIKILIQNAFCKLAQGLVDPRNVVI